MKKIIAELLAFLMTILTALGLVEPHHWSVDVSDTGVIESAYCTDADCEETVELNLALPMAQNLSGAFDCSDEAFRETDNAMIFYYPSADFETYVDGLRALGMKVQQTYTLGKNRYALLKHKYFTVYVSDLKAEKALRVYVGRGDDLVPKAKAWDLKRCEPTLWQLNIDNEAAIANGGMGYILQLTDGRFLVIDGGYRTQSDADSIYKILMENKPKCHKKPIIAGWFITHMHVDHYGALDTFTDSFLQDVTVEGFYYNIPYFHIGDLWPSNSASQERVMAKWEGAKLYRKLHSGMTFCFSGAKVQVLCTFEDVYPMSFEDGNDTSTVFKVTMGGQSILFLGDAEYAQNDRMLNLPKDVLKADILQYAHHGYDKQCRRNLYEIVNPSVLLWPMPLVNYESGTRSEVFAWRYENRKENEWARTSESVQKIILKDEGPTKMVLPYTPQGERIIDYHALYETLK